MLARTCARSWQNERMRLGRWKMQDSRNRWPTLPVQDDLQVATCDNLRRTVASRNRIGQGPDPALAEDLMTLSATCACANAIWHGVLTSGAPGWSDSQRREKTLTDAAATMIPLTGTLKALGSSTSELSARGMAPRLAFRPSHQHLHLETIPGRGRVRSLLATLHKVLCRLGKIETHPLTVALARVAGYSPRQRA